MVIAVDFDGTCVRNEYPEVGKDLPPQTKHRDLVGVDPRVGNFPIDGKIFKDVDFCYATNFPQDTEFKSRSLKEFVESKQKRKFILKKYLNDDRIQIKLHNTLPLFHLSYTRKTHVENFWDDITILCRGLIIDNDYNIISKPYSKFFNLGQPPSTEPKSPVKVVEKVDGSLIYKFFYKGGWHFAYSKGFHMVHVDKAQEIWNSKYSHLMKELDPEYTYIFEILGPDHKIVVDYPENSLVFTGLTKNSDLTEITSNECNSLRELPRPHYYGIHNFDSDFLEKFNKNKSNFEGYILVDADNVKYKLKLEEYLKLHYLRKVNEIEIWRIVKDKKDLREYLRLSNINIPDEFYDRVEESRVEFINRYHDIENKHLEKLKTVEYLEGKEFAEEVLSFKDYNSKIFFDMKKGKDYSEVIWEMIKPKIINGVNVNKVIK